VDPDNRRPIDYDRRNSALRELTAGGARECVCGASELLRSMDDGKTKLHVIARTLCLRKQKAEIFEKGSYIPLRVSGSRAEHVCAFARQKGEELAIVVAPRLNATLLADKFEAPVGAEVWGDTRVELPSTGGEKHLRNVLTGETLATGSDSELSLARVLAAFPVALLTVEGAPS